MAQRYPAPSAPLVAIKLLAIQLAADSTTADRFKLPFPARVVGIRAGCSKLAGSTPHTDVDITVKKGSTDLLTGRIAVVDSSAIQGAGGLEGTLSATAADLLCAEGDVLNLDVDITGGSSPLSDVWAMVFLRRLPQ